MKEYIHVRTPLFRCDHSMNQEAKIQWKSNYAQDAQESFPESLMKTKCGGQAGFDEAKDLGDIHEVGHRLWSYKSSKTIEERGKSTTSGTRGVMHIIDVSVCIYVYMCTIHIACMYIR